MKISVEPKSFVEAVTWVTKGYDPKNPSAYVALVIDKSGQGHLSHSSSTFMKCPLTVLSSDAGKNVTLALEGQYLQRLAGALSGVTGSIDLSQSKPGAALEAKTSNGKFTIPVFDVTVPADPKTVDLGDVDDHEWFDTMQRLSKLSESDAGAAGAATALSAVDIRLDVESKKVVLMATDRYAMAEVSIDFDPSSSTEEYVANNPNSLLPENSAAMIAPTKGLASAVTLVHEPKTGKFGYVFGDGRIALFSLVDAKPLPYLRMKETAKKAVASNVVLSLKDLKKSIQTISNLAWNEATIQFRIGEKSLTVEDDTSSNKVSIDVESSSFDPDSDNPLVVSFIRSVINEAFAPITTDKISLSWKDAGAAFTIGCILDDGSTAENVFILVAPKIPEKGTK